jgi:hypothetical protein
MNTLYEIDARILVLETELTELRARRNTFAPLCQLPAELIVRILKTVQRPTISPEATILQLNWEPSNLQWCRFIAVCRYIRAVALGETELWSFIDLQDYSDKSVSAGLWLDTCIKRAGMHDLVVRAASPNLKINLCARDDEYWSRAYAVVRGSKELRDRALKRKPARLQILSYHGSLKINDAVLGHERRLLQSLSVSKGHFVSSSQFPTTLRRLSIQNTHLHHSWNPLWDFMKANSQLEVLELNNIRIQDPRDNHEDLFLAKPGARHMPRISMPLLQVLKSRSIPSSAIRLLQVLSEPSKELHIEVPDDHDTTWYIGSDSEHTRERSEHYKLFAILNMNAGYAQSGQFVSEGDSNHLRHHLTLWSISTNGTRKSFSTRCVIMGPHPALDYVNAICLWKVVLETWMSESGAGHLNKIGCVCLRECAGDTYSWNLFELWLRSRMSGGWSLEIINYQDTDPYVRESVARLSDTGVRASGKTVSVWRGIGEIEAI